MSVQTSIRDHFIICGKLDPESFVPWIERHAAKLDVALRIHSTSIDRIELDVEGLAELVDMMDVGCSLGPIDVQVETIERIPLKVTNMGSL